ncbi:MAG: MarR family winged helix-turn-helix transcriptional regulator [Blautia sp.]
MDLEQSQQLKEYSRLYRETDALYHEIAWKLGLSDSAFSILYSICELGDGCLQKDICELYSISKQTVNSAIRKLEKEGVLYLAAGKGKDKHILLTEGGRRLVQEKILPVIAMENSVFEEMTSEESRELLRLTRKYIVELREKSGILPCTKEKRT